MKRFSNFSTGFGIGDRRNKNRPPARSTCRLPTFFKLYNLKIIMTRFSVTTRMIFNFSAGSHCSPENLFILKKVFRQLKSSQNSVEQN